MGVMLRKTFERLAFLLLASFFSAVPASPRSVAAPADTAPLKIFVQADEGAQACLAKWGPTAARLEAEIPGSKFLVVPVPFVEIWSRVEAERPCFFICDTQLFAELREAFGAECLATMKTSDSGNLSSSGGAAIFAPAGSGINSISDLKNKKVASSHPFSFLGWGAALIELKNAGLKPDADLGLVIFTGMPELTVMAVSRGMCDAGVVKAGVLERMETEGRLKMSGFKILPPPPGAHDTGFAFKISTRLYPEWAFAAMPSAPAADRARARAVLMNIKPPEAAASAAGIRGWDAPGDYAPVVESLKDMEIGYFGMLNSMSPLRLLRRHFLKIISLACLIVLLTMTLIYVMRKNRALTEARATIALELEKRNKIEAERQLKREFESIVSEALQLFFMLGDFNDCFQMIFARVRGRIRLNRVLVFQDVSPEKASLAYEFVSDAEPLQARSFVYSSLAAWKKCLVEEVMIDYPNNASLNAAIKGYAASLGARRMLALPLYVNNAYSGFMVFVSDAEEPLWNDCVASLFFPLTNIVSAVLEKKRNFDELRQMVGTRDKFLAILAHDLKSPLASFSLLVDMLREGMLGEEKKAVLLKEIKSSIAGAVGLIESVVMWAKMQSGDMAARLEPFSIDEAVVENISLLSNAAAAKKIAVESAASGITVFADRQMVLTVIRNLLNNAIKFTPPGGAVKIYASAEGNYARISVEDGGVGMDRKTIARLFKIDEKIVSVGTAGERGSGFGLILCNDFVARNGGRIFVESGEGVGTRIAFTLAIAGK